MYHEFSNTRRSEWRYSYKGSELLAAATRLLADYKKKEMDARQHAAKLLNDMSVGADSKEMQDSKREIERIAKIHEELKVYVHEFTRRPDESYILSLGDVVFFEFPEGTK